MAFQRFAANGHIGRATCSARRARRLAHWVIQGQRQLGNLGFLEKLED